MIIKLERIEVQSRRDLEMIDITNEVDRVVTASGVRDGVVMAMTTHTSSGLLVTEGVECLERDVLAHLGSWPQGSAAGRIQLLAQPLPGLRWTSGLQRGRPSEEYSRWNAVFLPD